MPGNPNRGTGDHLDAVVLPPGWEIHKSRTGAVSAETLALDSVLFRAALTSFLDRGVRDRDHALR